MAVLKSSCSGNLGLVRASRVYYLMLHLRLGTRFYAFQLVELFAYELPAKGGRDIGVYNFHGFSLQDRFILFSYRSSADILKSLTELFPNTS